MNHASPLFTSLGLECFVDTGLDTCQSFVKLSPRTCHFKLFSVVYDRPLTSEGGVCVAVWWVNFLTTLHIQSWKLSMVLLLTGMGNENWFKKRIKKIKPRVDECQNELALSFHELPAYIHEGALVIRTKTLQLWLTSYLLNISKHDPPCKMKDLCIVNLLAIVPVWYTSRWRFHC